MIRRRNAAKRRPASNRTAIREHIMSTTGWIVLGVIVVVVLWVISVYNSLVSHGAAGKPGVCRHRRPACASATTSFRTWSKP